MATRNAGVRVGERRKMAKKVFDPSDNNVPSKRKRGRPVGSLNKSTIKKRLMVSGQSVTPTNEGTPVSESQLSLDGSADENEMEQEDSIPHETSGGVCSVCLVQKPRGSNDRVIECRDCNNKAHLSCLQSGSGILKPRPDNTWQCPHCKTCVVCCETNDAVSIDFYVHSISFEIIALLIFILFSRVSLLFVVFAQMLTTHFVTTQEYQRK